MGPAAVWTATSDYKSHRREEERSAVPSAWKFERVKDSNRAHMAGRWVSGRQTAWYYVRGYTFFSKPLPHTEWTQAKCILDFLYSTRGLQRWWAQIRILSLKDIQSPLQPASFQNLSLTQSTSHNCYTPTRERNLLRFKTSKFCSGQNLIPASDIS